MSVPRNRRRGATFLHEYPELPAPQGGLPGVHVEQDRPPMTEREIDAKQAELDRLLNDPETRMDPHRVWSLLAELSRHAGGIAPPEPAPRRGTLGVA